LKFQYLTKFEPDPPLPRQIVERNAQETPMIAFQLIGLVFTVMFFGAMITGRRTATR
jgi:hypothetical protein